MPGSPQHGQIRITRVICGLLIHTALCRGDGITASRLGDSVLVGTILGLEVITAITILGIVLITVVITDIAIHIMDITDITIRTTE